MAKFDGTYRVQYKTFWRNQPEWIEFFKTKNPVGAFREASLLYNNFCYEEGFEEDFVRIKFNGEFI